MSNNSTSTNLPTDREHGELNRHCSSSIEKAAQGNVYAPARVKDRSIYNMALICNAHSKKAVVVGIK